MLAFAIWDKREKQFFVARDKVGIKPFYYSIVKEQLVFGSEIIPLLVHPDIERRITLVQIRVFKGRILDWKIDADAMINPFTLWDSSF